MKTVKLGAALLISGLIMEILLPIVAIDTLMIVLGAILILSSRKNKKVNIS